MVANTREGGPFGTHDERSEHAQDTCEVKRATYRRTKALTRTASRSACCASSGWLSTRARTDLAYVRVYSLHVLQKRIQGLVRRVRQGDQLKIEQLETVRQAMLTLWHDAHQYTPSGVPLSYEQFEMQKK